MADDEPVIELERIQKEIEIKRAHAAYIGDGLIELGNLLKGFEPESWLMEDEDQVSDRRLSTRRLRADLDKRFSREQLKQLLGQIRELRRQEGRLKRATRKK